MAGNSNLHMSKAGKTDEFYTQLSTIEDELRHYRNYFNGKVVFCNADDPAIGEDGKITTAMDSVDTQATSFGIFS